MRVAAVIPARLGARRFPRKVLARETGKFLVQHVYERVADCPLLERVIIATDSEEVFAAACSFDAEVQMTSPRHVSGTDRVAEVARGLDEDIVINVQGDEPLIAHDDLEILVDLFRAEDGEDDPDVVMTTLAVERDDLEGFHDPNIVKVVLGVGGQALYFSRSPVPHVRDPSDGRLRWLQHVGIYAYRRRFLLSLATLPPTTLEQRERLEQLRVLERGYRIRVGVSPHDHLGIDTPQEYERFVEEYRNRLSRSTS